MKRKSIGAELIASMEEAVAIVQGKIKPARVTKFKPSVALDIRMIRLATGLSRAEFAKKYALDARALQDWEQGRRKPDRAARAYLKVIAHKPKAVEEALAS
jgi:putative transcriptional regulator